MIRTTVRERILYEYAKLIGDSAVGGRNEPEQRGRYWRFVVVTYRKLVAGTITPSSLLRENKLLVEAEAACAYCGETDTPLQWEHIIPLSRSGCCGQFGACMWTL